MLVIDPISTRDADSHIPLFPAAACFSRRRRWRIRCDLTLWGTPLWQGQPDVCETHPIHNSTSIAVGSFHMVQLRFLRSFFLPPNPKETLLSSLIRHHQSSLVNPSPLSVRPRLYFPKMWKWIRARQEGNGPIDQQRSEQWF